MPTPELSIVIAAQGDAAETARCLSSLTAQKNVPAADLEIIVVHETPPTELQSQFPHVQFLASRSSSIPKLHGLGIENAGGSLVALTEGHCTFADDWAQEAIAAHKEHAEPVIGGCVAPGQELDPLNLGLFLCDYAQFLPPLEPAQTH
ncbi:MAG: glycosyltransferase, partial [Terriglobales bacterium]